MAIRGRQKTSMPKAWVPATEVKLEEGTLDDLKEFCNRIALGEFGARSASQALWKERSRYISENVFSYWTRGHKRLEEAPWRALELSAAVARRRGPPPILGNRGEGVLLSAIVYGSQAGICFSKGQVRRMAKGLARKLGVLRKDSLTSFRGWFRGFQDRCSKVLGRKISWKKQNRLSSSRQLSVTSRTIRDFDF
eukprot:scaffold1838_cov277-Pinguiococcus_pyrenoidosus.AAC.1